MKTPTMVTILVILALSVSCVMAGTIQMGSYMDVTYVNVVTDISLRNIQATADSPSEVSYSINAKGVLLETPAGFVMQPATGTIMAFMDVRTPELIYSESTSATGYIDSFVKNMYFQDGELRF
jgi:hypothetical protein